MDYGFSSQEELYERVSPALRVKIGEFNRLGYSNIKSHDIWEYLIETKWSKAKDLILSQVVDDILCVDIETLSKYVKLKTYL